MKHTWKIREANRKV